MLAPMRPPPLPLALAALAYAAAARAQGAPRADGPVLLAPPTREVPAAERRLTAPQLGPRDALGPPRWGYGALAGGLVAGFGAAVTWLAAKPPPARERRSGAPLQPVVELRRVTVSVGGAARGAIEAALADVGGRADPTTPAGRLALVTAVRDAIVQARAMVAHGAFQSWQLPADRGEEAYAIAAKRMRSKRPRSITGYARPGDPSSLAAVTLVVLVRGALAPLPASLDARGVVAALESMVPPRADMLLAADLAWAPPDPGARITDDELAAVFPELLSVYDATPRRACAACRAQVRAEELRCPACGAG